MENKAHFLDLLLDTPRENPECSKAKYHRPQNQTKWKFKENENIYNKHNQ